MTGGSGKVMSLNEAVSRLVHPGDTLAMGLALEGFVPFAAGHEIIRQGIGGLRLIGPISNILFDQLIGCGLVDAVEAAWVGNVSTGIGYSFKRAVERGEPRPLAVINHSNYSVCLALEAGARGLPMAVSNSPLGSDIVKGNPAFKQMTCPFSGQRLLAVRAINPDVTILHVQRADPMGDAMCWGATGVSRQAALASRRVIVTCEEIVDPELIRADPDRTLLPGLAVDAVCEVPWGAHPAPVQGYYGLDNQMFLDYASATREPEGFAAWMECWVRGVSGRGEYLELLGRPRWEGLMVQHPAPCAPVDYGW